MVSSVPVLGGEPDLFRTIQLLPGVIGTREGDSGFFVRGGNSDQNLILLDEAPIHNAFHLLGTFSTFNPDAVKNVTLYKGIAPSKFGGKCSSVLDVYMNEGNLKRWRVDGGVGLIFSRLTVQGPVVKDKASFMLSGRRTYIDLFAKIFGDEEVRKSILYFYDFNMKANVRVSKRDRIYFSGYSGRDMMGMRVDTGEDELGIRWGNQTGTFRWNHVFNEKFFSNTSLVASDFRYSINVTDLPDDVRISSDMTDVTFKEDMEFFMDTCHTMRFGARFHHHQYKPVESKVEGDEAINMLIGQRKADEYVFYVSHQYSLPRFQLDWGIRYSRYHAAAREDFIDFESMEEIPEEFYDLNLEDDEDTFYVGLEPRISIRYLVRPEQSFKIGYARNIQNVHMLTSSVSGTPLNTWHPSSSVVKPQVVEQIAIGYFRESKDRALEMSAEVFYKDLKHQMDYKDGADIVLMNYFESEVVFGRGWAYGLELFVRKQQGQLTGWVGYALSRSMRKFEDINDGRPFPATSDRMHDFKIVGNLALGRRWTLFFNWLYQTGAPVTVPYGKYEIYGRTVQLYTDRNGYRMPPYHRLDVGFVYRTRRSGSWHFMLYNAYARKNVYTYLYSEGDNPGDVDVDQLSLFSVFPSVSYQFAF